MRAKDMPRLNTLRMLKTAMKNAAIEKGGAEAVLDDVESTAIIRKQIKQRQDSIEGFEEGGTSGTAANEKSGDRRSLHGLSASSNSPRTKLPRS